MDGVRAFELQHGAARRLVGGGQLRRLGGLYEIEVHEDQ